MNDEVATGLCATCRHARGVRSDRGAPFLLCDLSFEDRRFPKYPRLPVLECAGHSPPTSTSPTEPDADAGANTVVD